MLVRVISIRVKSTISSVILSDDQKNGLKIDGLRLSEKEETSSLQCSSRGGSPRIPHSGAYNNLIIISFTSFNIPMKANENKTDLYTQGKRLTTYTWNSVVVGGFRGEGWGKGLKWQK